MSQNKSITLLCAIDAGPSRQVLSSSRHYLGSQNRPRTHSKSDLNSQVKFMANHQETRFMRSKLLVTLAIFLLGCSAVDACTTFCLASKDEVLFGRNYDWDISDALVFVNKRGVAKVRSEEHTSELQ